MADTIAPIIALAQACVTATFDDLCEVCGHSGRPMPPAGDCCDCGDGKTGRAYIQVDRVYPVGNFPAASTTSTQCGEAVLGVEFAITLYRCVVTVDDEGAHPPCETTTAEMFRNIDDMERMRKALICCMRENAQTDSMLKIIVTEQTPINPQGGCGGTVTRAVATSMYPVLA